MTELLTLEVESVRWVPWVTVGRFELPLDVIAVNELLETPELGKILVPELVGHKVQIGVPFLVGRGLAPVGRRLPTLGELSWMQTFERVGHALLSSREARPTGAIGPRERPRAEDVKWGLRFLFKAEGDRLGIEVRLDEPWVRGSRLRDLAVPRELEEAIEGAPLSDAFLDERWLRGPQAGHDGAAARRRRVVVGARSLITLPVDPGHPVREWAGSLSSRFRLLVEALAQGRLQDFLQLNAGLAEDLGWSSQPPTPGR